jgi:hypothetical protein
MDFESYLMSSGYTDEEVDKINQTIINVTNSVTSGIKSITQQNGNQLVFTLNDNTVVTLTVTGLSSNDYTTLEKNKLALLNSDILSKFTYADNNLLFNGNQVENNKLDLSNYYTQIEINGLLSNKANSVHNHNVSEITNLHAVVVRPALLVRGQLVVRHGEHGTPSRASDSSGSDHTLGRGMAPSSRNIGKGSGRSPSWPARASSATKPSLS